MLRTRNAKQVQIKSEMPSGCLQIKLFAKPLKKEDQENISDECLQNEFLLCFENLLIESDISELVTKSVPYKELNFHC